MTALGLRRPFYGYSLIAVTFLFLALFSGCGVFAFSLFVKPLEASLGWGRGEVMAGFTLFYLTVGLASPVVGRLVDHHGARRVIPVGALVMGLGFVLLSRMNELYLFYLFYVMTGIGSAGMGLVPCSTVVSNWFKRRRGTAVGLMSGGIGAGGVLMAPFVGYVLSHFDWRAAYLSMGVLIMAVTIPLSLLVVRTRPSELGLHPDGDDSPVADPPEASGRRGEKGSFTLRQAATTRTFWLIAVAFAFFQFANMGVLQASAPFLEDVGYSTATAALAVGVIGFGSGAGKVFFGWLCDRMRANLACAIGTAMQLAAVLLLLTVGADSSLVVIWAYALLLGWGVGAWLPTLSILTSSSFGLLHYGAVFGALNLAQSLGTSMGPLFSGFVHDATGSYQVAFTVAAVLLTVAIPVMLLVKRPGLRTPDA